MVKIKNWSFVKSPKAPYTAPELTQLHISGNVYGHPTFADGEPVVTSPIIDINQDERKITCKSRTYLLDGEPDEKWVQWLKDTDQWDKYKDNTTNPEPTSLPN